MKTLIAPLALLLATNFLALGDGKVMPPHDYKGSLEEKAQEAIIVFTPGTSEKSAVQDLITVTSEAPMFSITAW